MGPLMCWLERCLIYPLKEHMHMRISRRSVELLNSKPGTLATKPQVQYFDRLFYCTYYISKKRVHNSLVINKEQIFNNFKIEI